MTSHKRVPKGHSRDELDTLIRWALEERVSQGSLPSQAWERIRVRAGHTRVRAERSTARGRVGSARGGYRAVMVRLVWGFLGGLSGAYAFLCAQTTQVWRQDVWKEWRLDPDLIHTRLLIDQCAFQFVLAF
jgi:hypothetical protein